jgi:hypothetical protein
MGAHSANSVSRRPSLLYGGGSLSMEGEIEASGEGEVCALSGMDVRDEIRK